MPPDDLSELSVAAAAGAIARGAISPVELVDACLRRIAALDRTLHAFITVVEDRARSEARLAEQERRAGRSRGPLHGIPVAVKDNLATAGIRTTCASGVLRDWIPDADAAVVTRLRDAGAILLGKTNMMEFAWRGEHPDFPMPRNPWAPERSCGGSSSGSAAAVAADLCLAALGTETGASIRVPAAFCGIVGLKPTYGLVSVRGKVPLARTLDHIGPMTGTVEDAALLLAAISGEDPLDPASVPRPAQPPRKGMAREGRGLRIGLMRPMLAGVTDAVSEAVESAAGQFDEMGILVEDVELPFLEEAAAAHLTIMMAGAAAYHRETLATRPDDYGPSLRRHLTAALAVSPDQVEQAHVVRGRVSEEFRRLFARVDLLMGPTTPCEAITLEQQRRHLEGQTLEIAGPFSLMTGPISLAGLPALSLPCGFTAAGLPLGLQLAGPPFADDLVLAAGLAYEQATPWHTRRPAVQPAMA